MKLALPLVRIAGQVAPSLVARVAVDRLYTVPHAARQPSQAIPDGGADFTATFEGHRVHGTCWGKGPLVYLVHGWAGGAGQWTPLIPRLVGAGYRVVVFDAPSHGESGPGPLGINRSNGLEFGKALDAVSAVHGPADTVIAHSLGAMATMLTLRFGWLATRRLVFLAPMTELRGHLERQADHLRLGRLVRDRIESIITAQTRLGLDDCDIVALAPYADAASLLVIHDLHDWRSPWSASAQLVSSWPGPASLATTQRLGHTRLLAATEVHDHILGFLGRADEMSTSDEQQIAS